MGSARHAVVGLGAALALLGSAAGSASPATAHTWPANVHALYEVSFNGFNVGTFDFEAQAEQDSYTVIGNASLSILLGAFTWDGFTRSFGMLASQAPKPASFSFDFKSNVKPGTTQMAFSDGEVTNVVNLPVPDSKVETIPLREQHRKGVLDPLTAIMAVLRAPASSSNPCDRRMPIFDGKERFDLILSPKGEAKITEQRRAANRASPTSAASAICRSPATRSTPKPSSWPPTTALKCSCARSRPPVCSCPIR